MGDRSTPSEEDHDSAFDAFVDCVALQGATVINALRDPFSRANTWDIDNPNQVEQELIADCYDRLLRDTELAFVRPRLFEESSIMHERSLVDIHLHEDHTASVAFGLKFVVVKIGGEPGARSITTHGEYADPTRAIAAARRRDEPNMVVHVGGRTYWSPRNPQVVGSAMLSYAGHERTVGHEQALAESIRREALHRYEQLAAELAVTSEMLEAVGACATIEDAIDALRASPFGLSWAAARQLMSRLGLSSTSICAAPALTARASV